MDAHFLHWDNFNTMGDTDTQLSAVSTKMASEQALQFLEANLDIEKLINEVQDRPALWDMTQKDYSDRIKRKQCWEEITALVSSGSDLTLNDKKKLGDTLHKKWKNIRDRFARDIQERNGKSADGARKKAPYMYSQQLEFLSDTVTSKRTVSSLESAENTSIDEEVHDDEEDEQQEATSASSTRRMLHTKVRQIGKRRLHPVEKQLLRTLDLYEKRTRIDNGKEKVDDKNDNRHFLLSLEQSLASLPRHCNTSCRIEIMQCIKKYETGSQQPLTTHSNPAAHQQCVCQRRAETESAQHAMCVIVERKPTRPTTRRKPPRVKSS